MQPPRDPKNDSPPAAAERPADLYRFESFARIAYPVSAATHAALIGLFALLGQTLMWQYNVISVAVTLAAIQLNRRRWIRLGYAAVLAEVLCYSALGTLVLGWESGTFLFFIFPAITVFFVPGVPTRAKFLAIAGTLALAAGVLLATRRTGALSPLEPDLARAFLFGNLAMLMATSGVCLLAFARAIHAAEDGLQAANRQLARFSDAVSEYLDPMLVGQLRDGADLTPRLRFVTVFFADLAGSTRISRAMNQEAFGGMMREFVGEMQAIIKANRGYIEDISGDGIFGYLGCFDTAGPEADARRAVEMAQTMLARLAEMNPGFRERYGLAEPLYLRIGISSGEAQVGKTDGARAIYTANGDIVNLGAKLEVKLKELSRTGGILLSERTASLAGDAAGLIPHRVVIEGMEMTVYRVRAAGTDG